jgi:hypothetical protein
MEIKNLTKDKNKPILPIGLSGGLMGRLTIENTLSYGVLEKPNRLWTANIDCTT